MRDSCPKWSVLILIAMILTAPGLIRGQKFDGRWSGETDQGFEASFTVVDDRVTVVTIGAAGSSTLCELTVTLDGSLTPSVPIVDNGFSLTTPTATSFTLTGQFKSFTEVSGTLQVSDFDCLVFVDATWSAVKEGPAGRVAVSVADASVSEGDTGMAAVDFEVVLDPVPMATVSVSYATADGTAEAGVDYLPASGSLTLAPGVGAMTVPVEVLGDVEAEFDETFFLDLTAADGAELFDARGVATVLDEDGPPPALRFVEARFHGSGDVAGLMNPQALAMSPDGRHLYAAGAGSDALVAFARDPGTGRLTFVDAEFDGDGGVTGLDGVTGVVVSPDAQHVYAVSSLASGPEGCCGAVVVFGRDGATGRLSFVEAEFQGVDGVEGLEFPGALVLSPDGRHLYTASDFNDAVAIFERDATTGTLDFVGTVVEGMGDVEGLLFPESLTLSPDGLSLYVGSGAGALASFARDPSSGTLRFVEAVFDGVGGVSGIVDPSALLVSAEGSHLYVTSPSNDAVSVFARQDNGRLSFVEVHTDGVGGGLDRPQSMALSASGRYLYVASFESDAVAVFRRDSDQGRLRFAGAQFDDADGVDGLDGARALVLSPDGRNLYAAGAADDAVTVFAVDEEGCTPGRETLCIDAEAGDRRFEVSLHFDSVLGGGIQGEARATPLGSLGITRGGILSFTDPTNPEVLVKVLDGCSFTNHFWVFFAATTTVGFELTVTDTRTGESRVYTNPDETAAATVTDTEALAVCDSSSGLRPSGDLVQGVSPVTVSRVPLEIERLRLGRREARIAGPRPTTGRFAEGCVADASTLCIDEEPGDGRFAVTLHFDTVLGGGIEGEAQATSLSSLGITRGGILSFTDPTNPEVLVKVLDGCSFTDHFWVFFAATTTVGFELTVTDTRTGLSKVYVNPDETAATTVTDTEALAACPSG